jgi:hypothetical protein
MRFVISILMLLISLNVFGQEGKLRFTRIDTSCHYNNDTKAFLDSFYYDLPDLSKSLYKTHIRVSLTGKYIDLFSEDNEKFSGFVTNYVYQTIELNDKKALKEEFIISNRFALDSLACEKSAHFILESKQHLFQMEQIDRLWSKGFDCDFAAYNFKFFDTIISQVFVCPQLQNDSVFGKSIVNLNISKLFQELKIKSLSDSFVGMLPNDCYDCSYSFGANVSFINARTIVLNKRKTKIYSQKRANKIYLDSLSSALDSFIQLELVRLIPKARRKEFYDIFIIHFSKRNRLNKVTTDFTYFSRDDKKDFRKCRRKLRKVFRKINLDFVHSKFGFDKKLQFDKEGYPRINNEIY